MKHIYDGTLLIVDDNKELCKMVDGILQREGFSNIDMTFCVKETEEYFLHKEPHLVILDVNLPDGDGFLLMQRIRTVSDVPVLFLSARDEDSDRLLGLGLGADDYMVKPFLAQRACLTSQRDLKKNIFFKNDGRKRNGRDYSGEVHSEFQKWNRKME